MEREDDERCQEEFRQLVKSYMRFYAFVAPVVRLSDAGLEKLYSYVAWLSRPLPNCEMPPDIDITEDKLRLQAFRVEQKEQGPASLRPGDRSALKPISEFGAKPYTEDQERSLSEIIKAFNERHGTQFTRDDFIRFERDGNDCGRAELAGKSVAVPFVSAAAATIVLAEVIRLLHSGPAYTDVKLALSDLTRRFARTNRNYTAKDLAGLNHSNATVAAPRGWLRSASRRMLRS